MPLTRIFLGGVNYKGTLSASSIIAEGKSIVDTTDTEAFLVRKNGDGGDVLVVDTTNEAVGIGIAPVTGTRLTLPQENDAVTPTLAFGDGDSGLYESADDTIQLALGGLGRYVFNATKMHLNINDGPALQRLTSSATIPTVIPSLSDTNTGVGWAGADQLSLIAGGLEGVRVEDPADIAASETSLWLYDKDNNTMEQVTVGIADSGGAGFKVLRIAN